MNRRMRRSDTDHALAQFEPALIKLPTGVSAINHQIASGEITARVRRQIHNGTCDFASFAEAAHWSESGPLCLPVGIGTLSHFCADIAGRNTVHAYAAFSP